MNDYEKAVETKDLVKKFGSFTAVDSVNFYIEKGEIFGLLGPNGAGKTTLIRMLCGIMQPSAGNATVMGWDINHNSEEIKKHIGYMSQRFTLYNDLSALENIRFYTAIYGVDINKREKRIADLINTVGLEDVKNLQSKNLSGAWRQRLALACAIVHEPPMLFLDEATAGVDPNSRREFWDLIYEMAGQGTSILATTHYMDEAEFCNKVGMILDGKIIKIASPDTLINSLEGHLAAIECDKPATAAALLKSVAGLSNLSMHGIVIHALLPKLNQKEIILDTLEKGGIKTINFEFIQPSLEDVFINMVEQNQAE